MRRFCFFLIISLFDLVPNYTNKFIWYTYGYKLCPFIADLFVLFFFCFFFCCFFLFWFLRKRLNSTDRSKAVVPVLVLLFVALCFILQGYLSYVLPCVILFLCFSVLF